MIYAALLIFIPVIWLLPWWMSMLLAAVTGFLTGQSFKMSVQVGLACGVTWAALAFIKDGSSSGIISHKIAGLLSLPSSGLIFAVLFTLGLATGFLGHQAGAAISVIFRDSAASSKDVPV